MHSNKKKIIDGKLVYQMRGLYKILESTSLGTYICRKCGKLNGDTKKFMAEDLYMLPPAMFPYVHTDNPDLRYLNSDFAPLYHPFTKEFNIESYNTYWFNDEPDSATPKLMHKANESIPEEVDVDISTSSTTNVRYTSWTVLEKTSSIARPDSSYREREEGNDDDPLDSTVSSMETMFESIQASTEKLYFVCYTPADTIRFLWYIVQVYLSESAKGLNAEIYFFIIIKVIRLIVSGTGGLNDKN